MGESRRTASKPPTAAPGTMPRRSGLRRRAGLLLALRLHRRVRTRRVHAPARTRATSNHPRLGRGPLRLQGLLLDSGRSKASSTSPNPSSGEEDRFKGAFFLGPPSATRPEAARAELRSSSRRTGPRRPNAARRGLLDGPRPDSWTGASRW
jgi:hypothetical protein